jgi:hypothetical protein
MLVTLIKLIVSLFSARPREVTIAKASMVAYTRR